MMDPQHDRYFSPKIDGTYACLIFGAFAILAQLDNLACTHRLYDKMMSCCPCYKRIKSIYELDIDE